MALDQDFLRGCADMGAERVHGYSLFQNYYDGEQKTHLTERAKKYLQRNGLVFCENFSETIVDTLTDRLNVVGFSAEDNEAAAERVNYTWQRNRCDALQKVVHNQMAVKGDAFVIVSYDDKRRMPRYTWNRSESCKVIYSDDTDAAEFAVKKWNTTTPSFANPDGRRITRMNLYYPDRVERYYSLTSADDEANNQWAPFTDRDELTGLPQPWPTPWVDASGEPLGIPVIHFANNAKDRRYGRSELKSVVPQQDELNKMILDLDMVIDQQGWPQRWATGVTSEDTIEAAIGEIITTTSDQAKLGQFDAADPRGLLDAIEALIRRMASRSRTPVHSLLPGTGALPSGESLKTAEAPLEKKGGDRQVTTGDSWEDMNAIGLRLDEVFGGESFGEEVVLECEWDEIATRNETDYLAQQEAKNRLGVSNDTLLREMGYDPDVEREKRQQEEAERLEREEAHLARMAAGLDRSSVEAYNG